MARSKQATESRTETLAREYFATAADRDVEAMIAKWAPGGVAYIYGMAELHPPQGYRDYFGNLFAAFPDFEFEVLEVVASDEQSKAVVRWRGAGTFNGDARFQGLIANGARMETEGCDIVKFDEEDRVKEIRAYVNGADIAQKLGALPPTDSAAEKIMIGAMNLKTAAMQKIKG
jgi:predicted ester cyclase